MSSSLPVDANTPAGVEQVDGRATSTLPPGRPVVPSSRHASLPPIVVVATSSVSGQMDGVWGGAGGALVPAGRGDGALIPRTDGPCLLPRSVRSGPQGIAVNEEAEVQSGEGEHAEGVYTAADGGGGNERSLVPRYAGTASAPACPAERDVALSPASHALALSRHAHVCPTCGRPLRDFEDLDFMGEDGADGADDTAAYGTVARYGGGGGGGGGARSRPRLIQTYPGITEGPDMAAHGSTTSAISDGGSGSGGPHASSHAVVPRDGPWTFGRGLTPQYFRALALPPARASVLAIGEAVPSEASADTTSPVMVVSDGTGSDIVAYVSPTGRYPPRGGAYPALAEGGSVGTGLVVATAPPRSPPYPPQTAQPGQGRPAQPPASASASASTTSAPAAVPTPPLASTPAPTDSYYRRYFVEMAKLGSGAFGGVYLCQHVVEGVPLGLFALKKIPVGEAAPYLQSVLREVRILEEVKRHPNVVEYSHSWVEEAQLADFGPPVRCLFILMEYAAEGSLDAYMDRSGAPLSTVAVWYFFLSAVAGTAHLHNKGILHRDLKPQNLLLATSGDGQPPRVLVSDFGTAALLDDIGYERTGGTGTIEYMAPELLERDARVQTETYVNRHTKASDIWSLGMILHYLAFDASLPPEREDGSPDLHDLRDRGAVQRPPEMLELLRAMLQRDPTRRPSCQDIMRSTVVQTIIRAFNHPNRTEADIFEPMSAFRNGGSARPRRSYAGTAPVHEALLDEEAHSGDEGRSRSVERRARSGAGRGDANAAHLMAGFTQLLMPDADAPITLDESSPASSPRGMAGRGDGGSSRVELLSMTSTMPLGYLEAQTQGQTAAPPPRQRAGAESRAGGAGAQIPPLFARYHANDVRRSSLTPAVGEGGEGSPPRVPRGVTPPSSSAMLVPPQPGERAETGKRARQPSFSRNFASSPPPERKRRVATVDAAVQTDPVTIVDAP